MWPSPNGTIRNILGGTAGVYGSYKVGAVATKAVSGAEPWKSV